MIIKNLIIVVVCLMGHGKARCAGQRPVRLLKALRDQSAMTGNDVHYTEDNNSKLGEQIANQIKSMLGDQSGACLLLP